ncbi:hypothetical protein E3N88_08050 [Mikania micrantha]|uniref:Uncharacterized protein n=1 Tax=Mikania micrantha TaxID=192012 RepID=A0A5N6PI84_9ASTR|nr:hypothetical protein E3N88_08050 [Mikania micrantha]
MKTLIFLPPETSSTPPSSSAKSRSTSVDIIRAPSSSAVLDLSQTNAFCRLNRGLVDGIAEVLNRKKDGEEMDTELTRTDITKEGVDWVSINRLRQMALSGITLLDNLDVKNPDQSIKVRILKTWTQPDKYNPGETLKIEMILMDEQSVMIEAVCNKKYLIKFQKLLKEGDCFIIRKPSLGDNMNPYKILNHPYKVHLNWGSTVVKCMDFRGTQYGFSFSPFEQLIQNSVADNTILDVIGYVYTYFPIQESISTKTGKLCRRIKIHLQDYEGRIIYVTLWDSYADKFSEYMVDKEPGYLVDDFLAKTALNTVIEINDIAEVKKVVIVGTIKCVIPDVEWYYLACKGEYNNLHPDEFNLLLDRKFAFKIDISRFNLRNNVHSNMKFFGVSRITDDASVLSTLENKYKYEECSNTKVMHATSVDFSSQEIANSKDSVSFTGDNSTPFSENDATTARTVHRNGNSQHSFTDGLKRNLEDAYDVDDSPCQSVSKSRKKLIEDDESDAVFTQKLLAPKIEK